LYESKRKVSPFLDRICSPRFSSISLILSLHHDHATIPFLNNSKVIFFIVFASCLTVIPTLLSFTPPHRPTVTPYNHTIPILTLWHLYLNFPFCSSQLFT
jgi:hypothetical protein